MEVPMTIKPPLHLCGLLLLSTTLPARRAARLENSIIALDSDSEDSMTNSVTNTGPCSPGWAFHTDLGTKQIQSQTSTSTPSLTDELLAYFSSSPQKPQRPKSADASLIHNAMFHKIRLVYVADASGIQKQRDQPKSRGPPLCDVYACLHPIWKQRQQVYDSQWYPGDSNLAHLPPCELVLQKISSSQLASLRGQKVLGHTLDGPDVIAAVINDKLKQEIDKQSLMNSQKSRWDKFADAFRETVSDVFGDDMCAGLYNEHTRTSHQLLNSKALLDYDYKPLNRLLVRQHEEQQQRVRARQQQVLSHLNFQLSKISAIKSEVLIQLREGMVQLRNSIARAAPGLRECVKQRPTEDIVAWRAQLDQLDQIKEDHRAQQREHMKEIGTGILAVSASVLFIAADAGLPGVGTVLNAGVQATQEAAYVAGTFSQALQADKFAAAQQRATIAATKTISNGFSRVGGYKLFQQPTLAKVDRLLTAANQRVLSSETLSAALEGASGTAQESFDELISEGFQPVQAVVDQYHSTGNLTRAVAFKSVVKQLARAPIQVARSATQNWKGILKDSIHAAVQEGGWTAASFIPIVGPFAGLARQVSVLVEAVKEEKRSKAEYFATKDPILRSMIRMRNCLLESFLHSDVFSLRAHLNPGEDVRALLAAYRFVRAAADINDDLVERVHKRTRIGQNKAQHEQAVMKRLRGESKGCVTSPPPERSRGDAYLTSELSPSEWRQKFGQFIAYGDRISRTFEELYDQLVAGYSKAGVKI